MCGLNEKEASWQARNCDDLRTRFLVPPLALGGRRQHEEDTNGEQEPAAQEAAHTGRTENTAKSSSEKESSGKK